VKNEMASSISLLPQRELRNVNQNSNPKKSGSHGSAISEKFCREV
jgi:hypothetical protein